jgi:dTMP kinase
MRGVLVTFEGVEGSGKSTQIERLRAWLDAEGFAVLVSREPGGTPIGEQVRAVLLDPDNGAMDGLTELFLYLASRCQHVREVVRPAIQRGMVVLLDRYVDSSVAYQGGGRGLGPRPVARLNKLATGGLAPDLTILVDVPVEVGRRRKGASGLDRLERERVEFHERVRDSYLQLARRAPRRWCVVDGGQPAGDIARSIRVAVEKLLQRKGIKRP